MKLLISSYACRPDMGSEPAVGWSWITELYKYHEIWVLTNYTNEPYITDYLKKHREMKSVHFVYIRPKYTSWYIEWKRFERVYYWLWQKKALQVAKKINQIEKFDLVQHLTYVTCIMPTYMYKLKIPFVYGPISGGERIPKVIKYPMSIKDRIIEIIRSLTQLIPKISPVMYLACKYARKIISVTNDSVNLIPLKFRNKVEIIQAIGMTNEYFLPEPKFKKDSKPIKVLTAGRMLPWKGFEAGIAAAIESLQRGINIDLTVLGNGREQHIRKLKELAGSYLDNRIHFLRTVNYSEMKLFYDQFDILLNCSMRDSGCLVVMEGMSRGLPVICVNTGGPKVNTTDFSAIKVEPTEFTQTVHNIADALYELSTNEKLREEMSKAAYDHAVLTFSNEGKIKSFLRIYDEVMKK